MTTPLCNAARPPVKLRQRFSNDPTTLLIYLFDVQSRLEWLAEDMHRIGQQITSLGTIGADPQTHPVIQNVVADAIHLSNMDLANLQRVNAMNRGLREDVEVNLRSLHPLGDSGLPPLQSLDHLASAALAQRVREITGLPVLEAAALLPDAARIPVFSRPREMPCVVRNTRLIRRYGQGVLGCAGPRNDLNRSNPGQFGPSGDSGTGFPGAMANGQGDPEGIRNYADAYTASWETQARLFATGSLVNGNVNLRQFVFRDGSQVTIQAHTPLRVRSDDSRFSEAVVVISAGVAGAIVGGPFGAVGAGAATLTATELSYPKDAAWQGYTIQYFQSNASTNPWKTRYFYGWKRAPSISEMAHIPSGAATETAESHNFADCARDYSWWRWKEEYVDALPPLQENASERILKDTQRLVQHMVSKASTAFAADLHSEPSRISACVGLAVQPLQGHHLAPLSQT